MDKNITSDRLWRISLQINFKISTAKRYDIGNSKIPGLKVVWYNINFFNCCVYISMYISIYVISICISVSKIVVSNLIYGLQKKVFEEFRFYF
jgi:hypothetical protein